MKFAYSVLAILIANACGLLLASLLLDGFSVSPIAFFVAVLIFSGDLGLSGPILTKISMRSFPQLMGCISLVTIYVGLWITSLFVGGMQIGGLSNWLAATLLVWIGSLIASALLPIYVFKTLRDQRQKAFTS